jgi:hypothetical protein
MMKGRHKETWGSPTSRSGRIVHREYTPRSACCRRQAGPPGRYDLDVTTERTLALVLFIVSGILVTRLVPAAWRVWRIFVGTRDRRQHDAAGTAPLPSPSIANRIDALAELGFERLGETYVDLPGYARRFAWQFVDDTRTTYAASVPSGPVGALTVMYSAWPDGTWLSTMHPIGETEDEADFVVQTVATDLASALRAHRARQATLRTTKGTPRSIESMTDLLALDAEYRRRHGGRTLVRRVIRIVTPAILTLVLAVVSLALLILSAR